MVFFPKMRVLKIHLSCFADQFARWYDESSLLLSARMRRVMRRSTSSSEWTVEDTDSKNVVGEIRGIGSAALRSTARRTREPVQWQYGRS